MLNLENEENDYTKRRNTTDNDNPKIRERNFIKRQIVLGNIEVGETSEDMTLSMISPKHSSEDLSKSINDISETIFKMDSLDMENSKVNNSKHIKTITRNYSFIRFIFTFGNIVFCAFFTFSVRFLQADEHKTEYVLGTPTPMKSGEESIADSKSSKKRRKRVKRKNAPRKSTSVNQLTVSQTSETLDTNDTNTDRSSLDSHSSEAELKE